MMIFASAVALAAAAPAASAEQPSGGHAPNRQHGQMDHSKMDHSRMGKMAQEGKDCCCKDMGGKAKAERPAAGKEAEGDGQAGHSGH